MTLGTCSCIPLVHFVAMQYAMPPSLRCPRDQVEEGRISSTIKLAILCAVHVAVFQRVCGMLSADEMFLCCCNEGIFLPRARASLPLSRAAWATLIISLSLSESTAVR